MANRKMGLETVTLTDEQAGSRARILVGFGFNCYQFQVRHQDRPLEVLWSAAGFETGQQRPSGSGIPLLFPFPGRLRGTQLVWDAQRYELEVGDKLGNAIHGFVHCRPWRVLEQSATAVRGQFQASVDDPSLLERWPADFRITAGYQLDGNALKATYRLENPDTRRLPCGFGIHPYFRVPLGGPRAEDCQLLLPSAARRWELVEMLPTGRQLPLDMPPGWQEGLRFGEMTFDDVLTGLEFAGQQCTASVRDPHSGRRLVLTFERPFRECVVFTPPHREAICIEPYSCAPGAWQLEGVDAGLWVLDPGQRIEMRVEMRVE